MRHYFIIALTFLCLNLKGQSPTPLSIVLEPVISSGLEDPVGLEFQEDRLFIVEQTGRIRMVLNGSLLTHSFLNISSKITSGGERGLLGLAFDPDFETNRTFYVNYTNLSGNTVIAAYQSLPDSLIADPDSETILLTINQPYSNHNGGDITFGPDGYLYIGMGDGGSAEDPQNNSQNPQSLLGKMLRIEVTADGYTIPPTNPFAFDDFTSDEIWALGLRNPWRFSFDPLTGDLWMADVGQYDYEEIDFQPAASSGGENYGWRCYEGFEPFNPIGCSVSNAYDPPIFAYNHSGGNCSVTGGFVCRTSDSDLLSGVYLFADYCSGQLKGLRIEAPLNPIELGSFGFGISSFGQNPEGDVFMVRLNGKIDKIVDPCHSIIPQLSLENNLLVVDEGLNYYWFLNDEELNASNSNEIVPEQNGVYYCLVENEYNCLIKSNEVNVINVGLNASETLLDVKLFPNPFEDKLYIETGGHIICRISIYSMTGVLLQEIDHLNRDFIDVSGLPQGMYLIELEDKKARRTFQKTIKK